MTTAVNIKCLLGRIQSPDEKVVVNTSKVTGNSSRWIFDIEQNTAVVQTVKLQLLDFKTGKVKDSLYCVLVFTPLDDAASRAHLHVSQPNLPILAIKANSGVTIKYRVAIDTVHSSAR